MSEPIRRPSRFFRPADRAGFDGNPLNQLVVPRPIGWVSTLDEEGRPNLAPFSFFNLAAYRPPQVMLAIEGAHQYEGGHKDTLSNIAATGEFVVNMATYELREAMNRTSVAAPSDVDEFEHAGLTPCPASLVRPPYVAESPVHLECTLITTVALPTTDPAKPNTIVCGEVVGIDVLDSAIRDGRVDVRELDPISRLGYDQYCRVNDVFRMTRPAWEEPREPAAQHGRTG